MPVWPGVAVAVFVGLVYSIFATHGTFRFRQSPFPHHVLVADGWLHGHMYARDEVLTQRYTEFINRRRAEIEQQLGRPLTEQEWPLVIKRLGKGKRQCIDGLAPGSAIC